MKTISIFASFAILSAVAAEPTISEVSSFTQSSDRVATIEYRLTGAPAVVTFSVETNVGDNVWVKVPDSAVTRATGDVNKLLTPDSANVKTIKWFPDVSWPSQKTETGVRVNVKAWPTNNPPDYMSCSLVTNIVRYYVSADAVPGGVTNNLYKTEYLLMRRIHATGRYFRIGRGAKELASFDAGMNAYTQPHRIVLSKDYYIGVYETTQRQYYLFAAKWALSGHAGDKKPVENIAQDPVSTINGKMAALKNLSGVEFKLPSEAQWEFACRAGTATAFYNGSDTFTNAIAWVSAVGGSEGDGTHEVGLKEPNAWGLYDMIGNVWEVCRDWYADVPYSDDQIDPEWTTPASHHVRRGGCYYTITAQWCNSAGRYSCASPSGWWGPISSVGFRLSCDAIAVK